MAMRTESQNEKIMIETLHILVSGRVQGVFYRASARAEAQRIGLNGFVTNCSDGRVEIVAQGHTDKLAQFIKWCWQGPISAKVDDVRTNVIATDEKFVDFQIRH